MLLKLVITALLSLLLTGTMVQLGRRYGWGKSIREAGPSGHHVKAGTPTMGGAAFLVATALVWFISGGDRSGNAVLLLMLAVGVLGLVDDILALRRSRGQEEAAGLLARWRILFQSAVGLAFALDAVLSGFLLTGVQTLDVFIYTFVIVGSINALNFSDGLDGLAAGMSVIMLVPFAAGGPAPLLLAALLGFLWYNRRPARIFMGGIGAEALGAGLAGFAIVNGLVWYLPLLALMPVLEVLSVVAQVAYFRRTGGKRLLKMSPLHHHFELSGFSEQQVTVGFWLATAVCTGIVLLLLGGLA
ncbi:MAG TPA: phospho-N-acetylmuramoyl-pentapeptide-transferase [Deinococcales bacterium]|nr:phospho-N-acetylmuramoyl-pentapeptide-transferase [Deinococcales bacterium]